MIKNLTLFFLLYKYDNFYENVYIIQKYIYYMEYFCVYILILIPVINSIFWSK